VLAEQVGVNAGQAEDGDAFSRTCSSTLKLLGPTLQPGVSCSMNSHRTPAGNWSPILIAIMVSS
jgi:hypothetical protein